MGILKPAVPKFCLLLVAGGLWCGVGEMLCAAAYGWLAAWGGWGAWLAAVAGLLLASTSYLLGFAVIARKNIARIGLLPDASCIFAFQAWTSYLLIAVMITLGVVLKASALPRHWLAVLYTAIGGGLLGGSRLYFRQARRLLKN